ncbi:hypothetical protein CDAR_195231 [Caerostris darwini]|uniref:Uncharacterized protein n=1 Tax=Caerostris darwini TaxID=1538125 RepID=A0AAV4R0C7_9ARAC|nr:hypothetical protein CDAR_195231 [Caerostris darwini]
MVDMHYPRKTPMMLPINPDHVLRKMGLFCQARAKEVLRGKKRKRGVKGKTGKAFPTESAHGIFYRWTVNVVSISWTRFLWIRASVLNAHNGMVGRPFSAVKKPVWSHYKPMPYYPPNSYPKRLYAISSWYNLSSAWWTCIIEGRLLTCFHQLRSRSSEGWNFFAKHVLKRFCGGKKEVAREKRKSASHGKCSWDLL